MKITELTEAQKSKFDEYVKKWTDIGLSTEPADRPRAEEAIRQIYRAGGLPPPAEIVWCGSPHAMAVDRARRLGLTGEDAQSSISRSPASCGYGQHDANWLAFYDFFRTECGLVEETNELAGLFELARSASWYLPHENICWVSERHSIVRRDDRGRLHCSDGPALQYPDGWSIWAVHGVRVPERVITQPIELDWIEQEKNAEIRRVMIDRYGQSRYLADSGAKLIDEGSRGKLWHKDIPDDEPIRMVEVLNSTPEPDGSLKTYFLRVPPTVKTAAEAVAWTFDKEEVHYSPLVET